MTGTTLRQKAYFGYHRLIGSSLGNVYHEMLQEDRAGVPPERTRQLLARMLAHCKSVPYYARLMDQIGEPSQEDPAEYLRQLPILTKSIIRQHSAELRSIDLPQRKWDYNTSGGSTGEPIRIIQDREFWDRVYALQLLWFGWAGRDVCEPTVWVWGSERDIVRGTASLKSRLGNWLTRTTYFNAFRMTPQQMRAFIAQLNAQPPRLIVAYAQAIYELARFVEAEGIRVAPQVAIHTSAGTLYPFMREKITSVFRCPVYNRYGSREAGDIACECEAHYGLHVAPWCSYVEVVDDAGRPAPRGGEGRILVTSLVNYAMPLIRYDIGDRGVLSPEEQCPCGRRGQILERVTGRTVDTFRRRDGTLVDGEYFTHLLYFRDWVWKFRVIQKDYTSIVFQIVKAGEPQPEELAEIERETKRVFASDCAVTFEFVPDIAPCASGKYRYTLCEIQDQRTMPPRQETWSKH